MIFAIALQNFGASGAAMIWRDSRCGELVRIGDSSRADLRLAGVGSAAAELYFDGTAWRARQPDGSTCTARDGTALALGAWVVVLVLGDDADDAAEPSDDDDAPRFTAGDETAVVRNRLPALLGASPWCALRVGRTRLAVAAIARRDARGATTLYPIPGVALRTNGRRARAPTVLHDGDRILAGATALDFADPREQLERVLGALHAEASAPGPAPARARWRALLTGRDAVLTPLEASLWAVATAVALGYALLLWSRW